MGLKVRLNQKKVGIADGQCPLSFFAGLCVGLFAVDEYWKKGVRLMWGAELEGEHTFIYATVMGLTLGWLLFL